MANTPNLIRATENHPGILVAATLSAASTAVYTGPVGDVDDDEDDGKATAIATATVCNTSGSARVAYIAVTKAGGGTARLARIPLDVDESCVVDELVGFLLGPGDVILAWASAVASVDIAISGAVSS
ncbi:hypothetical protein [Mycobacterium sp. PSTR-4-N]|uniref:hypothetical protein n=1 Tax=Mycobacterium sp. PSTR-4-N TaxID=2917745 RepID=UPI001F14E2B2|nr:hypothetical protein [Mycobacterium sp. PSTR-4-N]MCG7592373.1 hypothetical protein [Mycobacterium sp. PSTR-4-N]